MSFLDKIKGKVKEAVDEYKEDTAKKKEIKKLRKDAYFEAQKTEQVIAAQEKAKVERQKEIKEFKKTGGKGKGDIDFWGGIDRMGKELSGANKPKKKEKDIFKEINKML